MQTLTNEMDAALLQDTTFLCRIWELTLQTGEVHRFTDLGRDVTFGGDLYKFDPGISVSSVVKSSGGQPDNAQIEVTATAEFMNLSRIRQGSLKKAQFILWAIDWRDPDYYGLIELFAGGTAEQKFGDKGKVNIGLNSDIGGGASSTIGENYSRQCRATLGDARCKVNIEALKVAITIATITDNGYSFTSTSLVGIADDYFKFGKVVWTTGLNSGLTDEVKSNTLSDGKARLSLYPRNPMVVNDEGFIYPGCDFQVSTCGDKFNNLLNFRGEPYVPPPSVYVFSGVAPTITRTIYTDPLPYAP